MEFTTIDSFQATRTTIRRECSEVSQVSNQSSKGERGSIYRFGVPPEGTANFAWVQHFIPQLAPHGMAGFVLANGSMSSNQFLST